MKTAKALGLKPGDFVSTGPGFPAVIVSGANTTTPLCDVFGIEHEMGSVYAEELTPISSSEFLALALRLGHRPPYRVYSPVVKKALTGAGIDAN